MATRSKRFWMTNRRFRLMLTLELAVMLPAAALIYVNFHHVKSIKRNKNVEAAFHRDFQYVLMVAEKKMNGRLYSMTEQFRDSFPSADNDSEADKCKKLELILAQNPILSHVFLYDSEKGYLFRSRPQQMADPLFHEEHNRLSDLFKGWFNLEGKSMCDMLGMKKPAISCYPDQVKRSDGSHGYMPTTFFTFPQLSKERTVLGGISYDPEYMKQTFFPEILDEVIAEKQREDRGNQVALMVYPSDWSGEQGVKTIAASAGWGEGKPELARNLDEVFRGLSLGIKFQGTSAAAIASRFFQQSLWILGVLSLLMIGGLVLTYRSVSKEMALARLKSDFVSNVSHELRTPLSLIRLYAETLELGRIRTQEKVEEYYRIISKESERLTALINNILDFSRIEAGRKEYDLRETDIAELVRNTLDSYRYQIEQK